MQALKQVGMEDRATHLPSQLSGGEQQRVAIARALVNDPKIILADEPTGNLDAENQRIVFKLLSDLHAQGRTIVMVTHDENAGHLADRRLNLDHGRIKETLVFSAEENQDFDEVLEHLWDAPAKPRDHMQSTDFTEMQWRRLIATMTRIGLVTVEDGVEHFTPAGEERARNVIRRHRLAERLFMDVLSIRDEAEIESSACKFEHILSPDVTDRICTLLGHPLACPHGSPIPQGECCAEKRVLDQLRNRKHSQRHQELVDRRAVVSLATLSNEDALSEPRASASGFPLSRAAPSSRLFVVDGDSRTSEFLSLHRPATVCDRTRYLFHCSSPCQKQWRRNLLRQCAA